METILTEQTKTTYMYIAKGIVAGNCWGGGICGYATETIRADTEMELMNTANRMLKDGSLDSGMGFESLIGAVLAVECQEIKHINNKYFTHSEFTFVSIGELTKEQEEWLTEAVMSI